MSEELLSESIQLQILFAKSEKEELKAYEKLITEHKIENIVLQNIKTNDKRIDILNNYKINYVAWGKTKNKRNYSWVDLDNEYAIEIIINYLIKKNHTHISYINISEKYNFANERKSSFLKNLKLNKINFNPNYYASVKLEEPEKSFEVIKKMLSKNKKISAIICSTEFSALSAIKACNYLKYKIGKDISIITFDGALVRDLSSPPITAVSFPVKELGKRAINILFNKNKNQSNNYLAKTEIIERDSVHIVS
jgi:DNA-binding LacI/PurR family transcriptional regulator